MVVVACWLEGLFRPENVDRTVAALVASQEGAGRNQAGGESAKLRLADAEARLRKFQAAIAAGVDPAALVDVINTAHAERLTAQAEIDNTPAPDLMDVAEVLREDRPVRRRPSYAERCEGRGARRLLRRA